MPSYYPSWTSSALQGRKRDSLALNYLSRMALISLHNLNRVRNRNPVEVIDENASALGFLLNSFTCSEFAFFDRMNRIFRIH